MAAGFGYALFHEGLRDFSFPVGYDEFNAHIGMINQPLVHQPGEGWQYGVGGYMRISEPLVGLTRGDYS